MSVKRKQARQRYYYENSRWNFCYRIYNITHCAVAFGNNAISKFKYNCRSNLTRKFYCFLYIFLFFHYGRERKVRKYCFEIRRSLATACFIKLLHTVARLVYYIITSNLLSINPVYFSSDLTTYMYNLVGIRQQKADLSWSVFLLGNNLKGLEP